MSIPKVLEESLHNLQVDLDSVQTTLQSIVKKNVLNNVTVAQCASALSSRAAQIESFISVVLPASLAVCSYTLIRPLLDDNDVVDNCKRKRQLKRSVLSFQVLATMSSFMSLTLSLATGVYAGYLKNTSVDVYNKRMGNFKLASTLIKTGVLLAVLTSASVALGTYKACVAESQKRQQP